MIERARFALRNPPIDPLLTVTNGSNRTSNLTGCLWRNRSVRKLPRSIDRLEVRFAAWTVLTDDRIRKLYRGYLNKRGFAVSRPRGKSPQQAALFTRSPKFTEDSSLLASLCSLLGTLPRVGAPAGRQALASLSCGELLCQAFEVYRDLVANPCISFENLVFLIRAVAEGHELKLASCEVCGALTVFERITFTAQHCPDCASGAN